MALTPADNALISMMIHGCPWRPCILIPPATLALADWEQITGLHAGITPVDPVTPDVLYRPQYYIGCISGAEVLIGPFIQIGG